MNNPAFGGLLLWHIPDFLHTDGVNLAIAPFIEMEFFDQLFRQRSAGAFCEDSDLRMDVDSLFVVPFRLSVFADPFVASANTGDAIAFHQQLGASKSGEEIHSA